MTACFKESISQTQTDFAFSLPLLELEDMASVTVREAVVMLALASQTTSLLASLSSLPSFST